MRISNPSMSGRIVLVTGGRRGIGKALALAFARAGADIAICDIQTEIAELQATADEVRKLGRRCIAIPADVTCKADVENMVSKVKADLGSIDILINNAGIVPRYKLMETDEDTWNKAMDINVNGTFFCSQVVGKMMMTRARGNIINLASANGIRGVTGLGAYCVAKSAVIMLTQLLARELGQYNIRVNSIAPWAVMTERSAPALTDPEYIKRELPKSALGRFGKTDDLIGAVLFLASDAASWITGHTLVIDGGYLTAS